ncbi:hypothetical protein RCL1_001478 [Eukaryota sp. TZLM3-RCL]
MTQSPSSTPTDDDSSFPNSCRCSTPVILSIEIKCGELCVAFFSIDTSITLEHQVTVYRNVLKFQTKFLALPASSLWKSLEEALENPSISCSLLSRVQAISITGDPNSLVLLDRENTAISNIVYSSDPGQEKIPHLERLNAILENSELQGEILHENVGLLLTSLDYLRFLLTGHPITSISDAFSTGLWNVENCTWNYELLAQKLKRTNISLSLLPEIRSATTIIGRVTPSVSKEFNLGSTVLVITGSDSLSCSALSAGCIGNSCLAQIHESFSLVLTCKTPIERRDFLKLFTAIPSVNCREILAWSNIDQWSFLKLLDHDFSIQIDPFSNPFDPRGHDAQQLLVRLQDFTLFTPTTYQAVTETKKPSSIQAKSKFFSYLIDSLACTNTGSSGLFYIPLSFIPSSQRLLKDGFISISTNTTNFSNEILTRSYLESIIYRLNFALLSISETKQSDILLLSIPIKLSLSKSHVILSFAQMVADITGRIVALVTECSSVKGSAMVAAVSLKLVPSFDSLYLFYSSSRVFQPDSFASCCYNELYQYWLCLLSEKKPEHLSSSVLDLLQKQCEISC